MKTPSPMKSVMGLFRSRRKKVAAEEETHSSLKKSVVDDDVAMGACDAMHHGDEEEIHETRDVHHHADQQQEEEDGEESNRHEEEEETDAWYGYTRRTRPPHVTTDQSALEPIYCVDEHEIEEYIVECLDTVLSDEGRKHENWRERVDAMVTLERLVKGGAGDVPLFMTEMNASHHILECQIMDRRSSVSKQASGLVGVLMEYCGYNARSLALALQPSLLKLHGVTIAVIAQGAQECLDCIYEYCHDGRLLPHLCSVICTDRHGKIRHGAAGQLLRVIECWEDHLVEQYQVDLEQTMLRAMVDASSETRMLGRFAFEAYACRYRHCAEGLAEGLRNSPKDQKIREKLMEIIQSVDNAVGSVKATVTVLPHEDDMVTPQKPPIMTHDDGKSTKKRMTAGPKRIPRGRSQNGYENNGAEVPDAPKSAFLDKRRARKSLPGGAVRVASQSRPKASSHSEKSSISSQQSVPDMSSMDFAAVLRHLLSSGLVWNEKIACLQQLEMVLQSHDDNPSFSSDLFDMFNDVIIGEIGDAHYKVASQAMETLCAAMRNPQSGYYLSHYLESLIPALFLRISDSKEIVRSHASEALGIIKDKNDPDAVMQGLVGATRACKSVKAQCAIMVYFEEVFATYKGSSGNSWRTMLAFCLRMATNKNPEVREHAVAACARVYYSGKVAAVEAALSGLPTSPRASVRKAIETCARPTETASSLSEAIACPDEEDSSAQSGESQTSISMMKDEADGIPVTDISPVNSDAEDALEDLDVSSRPSASEDIQDAGALRIAQLQELAATLSDTPSEEAFRCLSEIDSALLALVPVDDHNRLGDAVWSGFLKVIRAEKIDEDLACAACSTIISYFNLIPKERIEENIDNVIEILLRLNAAPNYELSSVATGAGIQLVKAADPADAYSTLAPLLPDADKMPPFQGDDARYACCVLKFFRPCLRKISAPQLRAALDMSMPSLCRCFESPHPEIRHLSLDCIVSIQQCVGRDATSDFTQSMTKTQQKLIEIQCQKS
ncbi:CLIP-associated protein [Picochlorum sp. SENEW3]|nr:CLIP-associated protein [Picochlorum sp. SENEW3]